MADARSFVKPVSLPGFGPAGRYKGLPRRFKKTVYSIDSSTIALVANCMDWAKHRRRKAAQRPSFTYT